MGKRITLILVLVGLAAAFAAGAIAFATVDSEGGATGPQADRAIEAALRATGGGTANEVELDSENGVTWEVEVTKPNGVTVDVRLDENYDVVVIEGDKEKPDDDDESED